MKSTVWRLCAFVLALSLIATVTNVLSGDPLGAQVMGLIGAAVATFGAAAYTVGTFFPGATADGNKGGVAGLVASGCAVTLITGFWAAVQMRLSPEEWGVIPVLSLLLYIVIFLAACTLAFWCITEVVLRDRSRTAAVQEKNKDSVG